MSSLIEIELEQKALMEEMVSSLDELGEIPPALAVKMQDLLMSAEKKVDSYCNMMSQLENNAQFARAQAEKATDYAKKCERIVDRMKECAIYAMTFQAKKKLEGTAGRELKLSYRAKVELSQEIQDDPKILPGEYTRLKVEPDKKAIKDAIESGIDIPGCRVVNNPSVTWK